MKLAACSARHRLSSLSCGSSRTTCHRYLQDLRSYSRGISCKTGAVLYSFSCFLHHFALVRDVCFICEDFASAQSARVAATDRVRSLSQYYGDCFSVQGTPS